MFANCKIKIQKNMKHSALLSFKSYSSDETSSSDDERKDKMNKSNNLSVEHSQELDESISKTDANDKHVQSATQNTPQNARKHKPKKKRSKSHNEEKKSKREHVRNSSEVAVIPTFPLNKEEQTNCLSNSPLELKNQSSASTFSFSLIAYFKEPIEASRLSDFELDDTDSLFSLSTEAEKDSDNLLASRTESRHLIDSDLYQSCSMPNSPAKAKIDLDKNVSSNAKEPIEVICLSDTDRDESDYSYNCPVQVKKETDSSACSLIPYSKVANFTSRVELNKNNNSSMEHSQELDEDISKTNAYDKDVQSASQNKSINTKDKPEKKSAQNSSEETFIPEYSLNKQEYTHSLSTSPNEAKTDSLSKLSPNLKESNESSDLSELSETCSLPSSPTKAKHKQDLDDNVLSNVKKPIELTCLSDTNREQFDCSSNRPNQVKRKTDTSTSSLIPYFKAASFMSRLKLKRKSLVSNEYLNSSDCEESLEEGQCTTDDDSLQAAKISCLAEFPEMGHSRTKEGSSSKRSYSSTKEDVSTSYLKRNQSRTREDDSTPFSKRSYSRIKEDDSTPSSKRSHSRIKEDVSTPILKRRHSTTKEDSSTYTLKRRHSTTREDSSSYTLKRRHSTTKEDSSTYTLMRSNLTIKYDNAEENRDVSINLSKIENILSTPPPPEGSFETSNPFLFYKMFPPPDFKRSHSMTDEDSVNSNKFVFQNSTDHLKSYNFASSNSPIIRARRSLPARNKEDFDSYADNSAFHSSNRPARHSSSYLSETPEHAYSFNDSSRRHSYHDKNSYKSTYRACATDQTPYSPADSYHRHKRFRSDLPYYNIHELPNFQSDVGFIDSHCHLDFLFNRICYGGTYGDFQKENKDTFPVCYKGCVAIFCNPNSFKRTRFWQKFLEEDNVWASFGCHPHNARDYNDEVEQSLIAALDHPKVRALGEIGLDYSKRNNCPKDVQHEVFTRQLNIALKRKLPLVIHCRDAHDDGLTIMKKVVPKNYFIHLHCFSDSWDIACKWLEEYPNLYIGITNLITFPSASEVHEVGRKISLNRLLLETDAPYFVPKALARHLSNTNCSHPGMAIHVAAQIAALKGGIPLELVLHKTRQNTKAVYKI